MEPLIVLNSVSMEYKLSSERIDSFKEYTLKLIKNKVTYKTFRALDEVTVEIFQGDRIGVIGHNGAGKSTFLKIIAGVLKPTSGSLKIRGQVVPLLELGAGFDEEFTGAENIRLNGAIQGYSKEYLDSIYDEIVTFSELGEFINMPIKNYSSGMKAKLGFSIASQLKPDILLVDEILGVGDIEFRKKSSNRMKELMNTGKVIIVVSHNLEQIKALTDKVIWLEKGKILMFGETQQVCDAYIKHHKNKLE